MSGLKRRASLKTLPTTGLIYPSAPRRRSSLRPILAPIPQQQQEVRWDLLDRCFLPLVFCNAAAVIISHALHWFQIAEVTALSLFTIFALITAGLVMFYHNLKVIRNNWGEGLKIEDLVRS